MEDLKGITCPKCKWEGGMADLRVNEDLNIGCPKCGGLIKKEDYGIDVSEFMRLADTMKTRFVLDDMENHYSDVGYIHCLSRPEMKCDLCSEEENNHDILYGTPDVEEPKFCKKHYISVNTNSRFVIKEQ